ncbi:MAG TPA: metalloregulator ArsR/SmtB family transcription factor [Chloroflexota bacterium]|nr:metalloregulator ArsR/SmtB family transcription factor [Chloroflexota bacterium]
MSEQTQELAKVLRARRRIDRIRRRESLKQVRLVLCEDARLGIVEALDEAEMSVGELARAIGRRVPATSQHLRVLRDLGIVEGERRSSTVSYRLRPTAATAQLRAVLDTIERTSEAPA